MKTINLICISCYFGNNFSYVYPSPKSFTSYFFTNNPIMKDEIIKKGWIYHYINKPIYTDYMMSSIQAKEIKFLQYNFPFSIQGIDILYFDHKVYIKDNDIFYLQDISYKNPSSEILIREHENPNRKTIYDEINEANKIERYRKNMKQTISYISEYIKDNNLSFKTKISNTGVIYYNSINHIKPLLKDIYNLIIKLQQPECQILWAVLSQHYKSFITYLSFYDLDVLWKQPTK